MDKEDNRMSMKGLVKMRYFLNPLDEEYEVK
jgi:hypothetical protein